MSNEAATWSRRMRRFFTPNGVRLWDRLSRGGRWKPMLYHTRFKGKAAHA